jgi:phospholipid/cholesterol/gamma-HCH transport system permease protein
VGGELTMRDLLRALLLPQVLWQRVPARRVWLRQLYFSGLETLPLLLVLGVAVSGIIVGELRAFGQSDAGALDLMSAIVLGELAPLLTAFLITARSVPAMASELATMRVTGETVTLARIGISPIEYLVVPRLYGMATASLLLTIYFVLVAFFVGALLTHGVHALDALRLVGEAIHLGDILVCLFKSLLFGVIMAVVACRIGLRAGPGAWTEVPVAASRAVVRSLALVFLCDFIVVTLQ